MGHEVELKLALPPRAAGAFARHPLLAGLAPVTQRLANTYYDTADLTLLRRRIALRFRQHPGGWLQTVKGGSPAPGGLARRLEWEIPAEPGRFDFTCIDDPAIRDLLTELEPRLQPIFATDFERTAWQFAAADGVRIEVALDRGTIAANGRRQKLCEVELELLAGEVDDLFALARGLQHDLPLHPETASKAERGYRLYTDEPRVALKAAVPPIASGMTAVAAFRAVALSCIQHLQRNEAGVAESEDPEFVHQARVAIRRLRSALKIFAPVLPMEFLAAYQPAWRSIARALGEARNLDVFAVETLPPIAASFPGHPEVQWVADRLAAARGKARQAARRELSGAAYSRLLLAFTADVFALGDGDSPPDLAAFARRRLRRRARVAIRFARIATELDATQRHQMRIAFKRLRYALEFFAALLPRKRHRPYHAVLESLQELLGRTNDLATARQILATLAPRTDPGLVAGWLEGRDEVLRRYLIGPAIAGFLAERAPWRAGN